ncbi:unnamed protein product [Cuscuta europaea]|uniref:DUF7795 domain-containing protein n=2 Tax=Cuscuta europaea TaxID=41803 RepID=A0A9P1E3D5_CUSEU|nr:unnamed protein product [Cuscuta europaea]
MEIQNDEPMHECGQKILEIFSEFMTRIVKIEELASVGNRMLVGFQQGLEYVRRPQIEEKSELVEFILKANQTKRLVSYIEAGCKNTNDSINSINKLHVCLQGLQDLKMQAKYLMDELDCLLNDAEAVVRSANYSLPCTTIDQDINRSLDFKADFLEEEVASSVLKSEVVDIAMMMAVVCSMIKKDYVMQEKIISSLNLKSSTGELDTYCLMWSLRPYVDDEIMAKAWKLVH